MPDISPQYEKLLNKLIREAVNKIIDIYGKSITRISLFTYLQYGTGVQSPTAQTFNLDTAPALKKALSDLITSMHADILEQVQKAITQAWDLSNTKNDTIAKDFVGNKILTSAALKLIFNPNAQALTAFSKRIEAGMSLSTRVWNLVRPYKFELEAGLTDGINKGISAREMATNLKKYLKDPDKLFRRVTDKNGNLQLSRAAKAFHPGQGVYRSSFKNALRLTATETNMAYRSSDHERWSKQPFVKGILVETSNNHPTYDECDMLAGKYPKDFLFRGWHPKCLCHSTPILVTDDEFSKQEDVLLGLSKKQPDIKYIDKIPVKAEKWIADNAERIKGWSHTPFFIADNPQYVSL